MKYNLQSQYQTEESPTILDKRSWDSTATSIFFCHFSIPLKTVHLFQNFGAVLPPPPPPPTLYKVETKKKIWRHSSNIVCGARRGVGPL